MSFTTMLMRLLPVSSGTVAGKEGAKEQSAKSRELQQKMEYRIKFKRIFKKAIRS